MIKSIKGISGFLENARNLDTYSCFYEKSFLQYIGSKRKLIPIITKYLIGNEIVDLMAGTHSIGYFLKDKKKVYANDIMLYSYIIGRAIVESSVLTLKPLEISKNKKYNFFEENYSGTYFTKLQCQQLDSLKYSIEKLENEYLKSCYYSCVFNILDRIGTTAGHFDGFLKKDTKKAQIRMNKDVIKCFENEVDKFKNKENKYGSKVYNCKALDFLDNIEYVDTIYIDPPYNHRQYSTLYHILEMFAIYSGELKNCMYKYPKERYLSPYSYRSKAVNAFNQLLKAAKFKSKRVVFSYSNKGLISIREMINLFDKHFEKITKEKVNYYHRKQKTSIGSGNVIEYIFCLSNN